jgi:phthiocerol/phenolphthiocerol synthesis type-I polyketide synthase E
MEMPEQADIESIRERMLALWRSELQEEGIGLDTDFFELGLDSIVAVRLLGLATERFGVTLSFQMLVDEPTPRRLSEVVRAELAERDGTGIG